MALPQEELPYIKVNDCLRAASARPAHSQIPLHTLIRITPMAYGCHEERYPLPIEAVDTHRPNPKKAGKTGATGASGAASVAETEVKGPSDGTARDYFGAHAGGVAVHAESVKKALEQGLEEGQMTPKAASTSRE